MSSRFPDVNVAWAPRPCLLLWVAWASVLTCPWVSFADDVCCGGATTQPSPNTLRICADQNNLPFSNIKGEGFENKIAELLARQLNLKLESHYISQRMGFFRETLKAGQCELVMGAPTDFEKALTTIPYYRSTYVFVTRKDRNLNITSLDDSLLRKLKIGIQLVGGINTPPAQSLGLRGIVNNVTGFPVYAAETPTIASSSTIMKAVADGSIDIAIVWGPPAGYYAKQQSIPLQLAPVPNDSAHPELLYSFDISLAVKRGNKELRDKLNDLIRKNQKDIDKILDDYGIPRIPVATKPAP